MPKNYIGYAPEYLAILAALWILALRFKSITLTVLSLIVTIYIVWFFQGALSLPTDIDPTILYSPCDGVVTDIIQHDNMVQISIFLNIFNTHVQYSPFNCTVKRITHKDGSFNPAYLLQKTQFNEQTQYILHNNVFGNVLFVQIAGQFARSIVSFVKEGDQVTAMTPIGLIKLGSRCDIYVKGNLLVKKGDRIRIGDPLVSRHRN